MLNPLLQTGDGVSMIGRGDLITVLYGADARLERTRWILADVAELFATLGQRAA